MGWFKESICRRMQTICHCFSVASRQAREAEIDVPSRRRFRQMLASEEGTISISRNASTDVREVTARTGGRLRTFLDCLYDVRNRVEQPKTDRSTQILYRRLPE